MINKLIVFIHSPQSKDTLCTINSYSIFPLQGEFIPQETMLSALHMPYSRVPLSGLQIDSHSLIFSHFHIRLLSSQGKTLSFVITGPFIAWILT